MMDGLNRFPVKAVICALIFYGFRNLIVIYLYYVFELMFTRNGKLTKLRFCCMMYIHGIFL